MTPAREFSGELDAEAGSSTGVVTELAIGAEIAAGEAGPDVVGTVGSGADEVGSVKGSRAEGTGVGKDRTILFVGRMIGAGV